MSLLNKAEQSLFIIEIGETGILEVSILQKWLNLATDPPKDWLSSITKELTQQNRLPGTLHWNGRFAPSILSRSEAELFAVSTPRFALRVRLPHGSFANLRRLGSLCGQLETWLNDTGRRFHEIVYRHFTAQPPEVLQNARCVADAFLLAPRRIKDSFYTIGGPLQKAYGECEANEADVVGTVYARHIKAGGGMCAQASCFMATALLPQHALAVHGVAEVTILARDKIASRTRISLSGLNETEIENYFRHENVGLETICQFPIITDDIQALGDFPTNLNTIISFRAALESYVRSGMPIILPIDVGRMAGLPRPGGLTGVPSYYEGEEDLRFPLKDPIERYGRIVQSILKKNGLDSLPDRIAGNSYGHAVVILGCEEKRRDWKADATFVFHDPAHFPFMKATSRDLFLAGTYGGEKSVTVFFGLFLPITPQKVKMPLLNYLGDGQDSKKEVKPSLLDIARQLQTSGPIASQVPPMSEFGSAQFRLIEFTEDNVGNALGQIKNQPHWARMVDRVNQLARAYKAKHWVWLQWDGSSIWVWDAEKEPPKDFQHLSSLAPNYLLAISSDGIYYEKPIGAGDTTSDKPGDDSLQSNQAVFNASIVSSFATSFTSALNSWPQKAEFCELYTFMQGDAESLLPMKPRKVSHKRSTPLDVAGNLRGPISNETYSAFDRMAAHAHDLAAIKEAAENITKQIARSQVPKLKIIALASYFAGLSMPKFYRKHEDAVKAAIFLVRFAKALQDAGHPELQTIEMVAGSLIRGITPPLFWNHKRRANSYEFQAHLIGEAAAINALIESLRDIVNFIKKENIKVRVALEFEPGPLNTLGTLDRLERFCERIDDELKGYVGLNLDIAHFAFLANLRPASLSSSIRRSFLHSHASSHGIGHFGDCVIEKLDKHCLRNPETFTAWIDAVDKEPNIDFSNYFSVELEVCKTQKMIHDSWTNLESILRAR